MKLKKILCPTDFSEPAEEAFKAAVSVALDYSAELFVVYVVESQPFVTGITPNSVSCIKQYGIEMEETALKQLKALAERLISPAIQARILVEHGQPAVKIVDMANKIDADLVVIATHGVTGWRRAFLGSVTERVIKMTSKQMLIIRTLPPVKKSKG